MFRTDRSASCALQREWLTLHDGDSLLLRRARGWTIAIAAAHALPDEAGTPRIWLTEEGKLDDMFLHAGEHYHVAGAGRVALTAWGPVRVRLAAPARASAAGPGQAGKISRAGDRRSSPASRPAPAPRPAALRP